MNNLILDEMIEKALYAEETKNEKKKTKRNSAYYRTERRNHINRKKRIIKRVSGVGNDPYWYVKHDGELSKGKIHCSCPICRYYGPSAAEMRAKEKMDYMEKEYNEGEEIA